MDNYNNGIGLGDSYIPPNLENRKPYSYKLCYFCWQPLPSDQVHFDKLARMKQDGYIVEEDVELIFEKIEPCIRCQQRINGNFVMYTYTYQHPGIEGFEPLGWDDNGTPFYISYNFIVWPPEKLNYMMKYVPMYIERTWTPDFINTCIRDHQMFVREEDFALWQTVHAICSQDDERTIHQLFRELVEE